MSDRDRIRSEKQITIEATQESGEFYAEDFILSVLIGGIKRLIDGRMEYYAFVLICQGIEYLGAFYDQKPFEKKDMSKERFEKALKKLFSNSFYHNNQQWLFENLRGSLVHQFRPGKNIWLTSRTNIGDREGFHLSVRQERRVFVIEDFYNDFHSACRKLLEVIKRKPGDIDKKKLRESHLTIYRVTEDGLSFASTGSSIPIVFDSEQE